ncbi:lipopolysaccharide biosynthesis protein [Harryflintia acetispora]|uniref:lipopolysaccharide biosynthesis protein n=1 Tax=Harryflintia acetispora TaxID=1849041 RepID=UPI00189BE392|nr:polysaccharide biosynthesis C-terminal domain-containing protein [Harryflintia acetispora]
MERSLRQNKYYKLISNTLLFGIGTFGSKLLVFLLMPLYTSVLSEGEYGTVDLMVQMSNLCLPLVSVGVLNAIIRFGLDKEVDKRDVFTTGLTVIACGFLAFLLLEPLLRQIRYISDYTFLIYLYVLCSLLRSLCSQFVRAQQRVKLYTFDGVLSTAMVLGFNLFFLLGLKLGIVGYMLATILSDLCSALFLFVVAGLWRFLRYRPGMGAVSKAMLRYAVPLIPTTVFWWITNVSDRFIVSYMLGVRLDGLYAVSYKVPTVVVLVSNIFIDAWQMSAVVDGQDRDRSRFFSNVFGAFQSLVFLCSSGLILCSKLIIRLLVSDMAFYPAWEYVPILVVATAFSCMVTFLGSVYMVQKNSVMALATTAVGAGINIVLNLALIPEMGVNGAALATFVSYFVVFLLRAVSASRAVQMHWNIPKIALNLLIVGAQSAIMIYELPYWVLWELGLTGLMAVINLGPVWHSLRGVLAKRRGK